ncbi:MAG: hypothetical protein AAGK78_00635 [Planctomycetota bacterium]
MSIKTNNAMAALLEKTSVPEDVAARLRPSDLAAEPVAKAKPVKKDEPAAQAPEKAKPAKAKAPIRRETPSNKPSRSSKSDETVGMTDLNKGEAVKQFTLRMPVSMWARMKLMTTRAQLTGEGIATQQEMILLAVQDFLDREDDVAA